MGIFLKFCLCIFTEVQDRLVKFFLEKNANFMYISY